MSDNKFYCARFYVTYRCNSRCTYCNVWQKKEFQNIAELPADKAKKLLKQCYEHGVRYVDFTGGEPTLYPHLAEIINYAKELGIKTEVTSNCIATISKKKMLEVAKVADKFNTSLDTLDNKAYHQIRGVDCCQQVKSAVSDIAKVRSPKIMTVVTDGNIKELDNMIAYAQNNQALIYLSPMFPYIDKDGNYQISRYMPDIISRIFTPYTVVLLHFMEFFKNSGPELLPPCSANRYTLTFAPNGNIVLPCYHAISEVIDWNENLTEALNSPKFKEYAATSGKLKPCHGCCVIPYFGISFNYQFNKYFLLQSFSEKLYHLKRDGLNRFLMTYPVDTKHLNKELSEMMNIAEHLSYQPDMEALRHTNSPLYPAGVKNNQVITPIYRSLLTIKEYEQEREAKDCWGLNKVPHRYFDNFCKNIILPLLQKENHSSDEISIIQDVMEFEVRWWKFYMVKYLQLSQSFDITEDTFWLQAYLSKINKITAYQHKDLISEALSDFKTELAA